MPVAFSRRKHILVAADNRDDDRLRRAVRIAVRSDEAPPELLARGDVVVDGPAGLAALLDELARALS